MLAFPLDPLKKPKKVWLIGLKDEKFDSHASPGTDDELADQNLSSPAVKIVLMLKG